jgi:hypothetical protein
VNLKTLLLRDREFPERAKLVQLLQARAVAMRVEM